MTVFAVIAPSSNAELDGAIRARFPDAFYQIAPGQYFISANRMTAGQLMDRLDIAKGGMGRALILRVGSYTGWHAKDMWDWLAAQLSPPQAPTPEVPDTPPDDDE